MKRANSGLITARLLRAFSHSVRPRAKPMMVYGERSQHVLLRVSGWVRDADLRVATAAELAVPSRSLLFGSREKLGEVIARRHAADHNSASCDRPVAKTAGF